MAPKTSSDTNWLLAKWVTKPEPRSNREYSGRDTGLRIYHICCTSRSQTATCIKYNYYPPLLTEHYGMFIFPHSGSIWRANRIHCHHPFGSDACNGYSWSWSRSVWRFQSASIVYIYPICNVQGHFLVPFCHDFFSWSLYHNLSWRYIWQLIGQCGTRSQPW